MTEGQKVRVRDMWFAGRTVGQIAQALGVSLDEVWNFIVSENLDTS